MCILLVKHKKFGAYAGLFVVAIVLHTYTIRKTQNYIFGVCNGMGVLAIVLHARMLLVKIQKMSAPTNDETKKPGCQNTGRLSLDLPPY